MPGPGRLQGAPMWSPEAGIEYFHHAFRCRGTRRIGTHADSQHAAAIDSGGDRCRHWRCDAAIGEQTAFVLHGFDQARKGAAGANGHFERPRGKYIRRARVEIGSYYRGWDAQLFHCGGAKPFLNKLADAILPPFALLRLMKAEKISDADAPSKIAKIAQGNAVRIGCAK